DREEFAADVTRFCTDLRATKFVDPAQPVMVAGDPQWNYAATRMRDGIPVGAGLLNQIRQIAQACAAPWVLDCASPTLVRGPRSGPATSSFSEGNVHVRYTNALSAD